MKFDVKKVDRLLDEMESILCRVKKIKSNLKKELDSKSKKKAA